VKGNADPGLKGQDNTVIFLMEEFMPFNIARQPVAMLAFVDGS
jgi:hypothetical protein